MFNICLKHLSLKALGCVPVKVITVVPLQFFFFLENGIFYSTTANWLVLIKEYKKNRSMK